MDTTYTHPDVLGKGVTEGWADPITDPTQIDWAPRQDAAWIPFDVVDGRPVSPAADATGIRYGRNELGHWGEGKAADAFVTADVRGQRLVAMVQRDDGHGWALPGGHVDPGETAVQAAYRELAEESGLVLAEGAHLRRVYRARYVPDPRASVEAWMVTVVVHIHLGNLSADTLPRLVGADDAARAEWVRADSYTAMTAHLAEAWNGTVFQAHRAMLRDLLG